jgi:hypothetical protein
MWPTIWRAMSLQPAGERQRVWEPAEVKRLWRVWVDEFTAAGRPLIGEQFKLRLLTAQRGGEVLHVFAHVLLVGRHGRWAVCLLASRERPRRHGDN